MAEESRDLEALYARSDALRAEAARLQAIAEMDLSYTERVQNTERRNAIAERRREMTAAIVTARAASASSDGMYPQTPDPPQRSPGKQWLSLLNRAVALAAVCALVALGLYEFGAFHDRGSATDTPIAVNQAAYSPQTANRYSTNSSGQQTWSGIPISRLTGNEWMQMNTIEKAALVVVYLSGVPYCTESVSQGVNALDTIFGPVLNRTSDITGTFAGWIVADGCHKP